MGDPIQHHISLKMIVSSKERVILFVGEIDEGSVDVAHVVKNGDGDGGDGDVHYASRMHLHWMLLIK